jgi:hypothetical protein
MMNNLDEMYATALVNRQSAEPIDVMRDGSEAIHLAQADDLTQMATEMAGGTEPEGTQPMSLQQLGETIADVPAGLLKGAIQGTIGLPGDIEALTYGIRELIGRGADESMLDAFVRGIETKTILPTTENVKQWLDTNVGPLVPEGADQRRVEAARTAEFVGEIGGAGQTITETARAAARGAKEVGRATTRRRKVKEAN